MRKFLLQSSQVNWRPSVEKLEWLEKGYIQDTAFPPPNSPTHHLVDEPRSAKGLADFDPDFTDLFEQAPLDLVP